MQKVVKNAALISFILLVPPMEKAGERVIIFQGTGKNYQLGSKGDQKNAFV